MTETGPLGTVTSTWDLADKRLGMTTTANYIVNFQHLLTGEITAVLDRFMSPFASFGYDNLGRRASVTHRGGAEQSYAYDSVARLTSVTNDLAGTAGDLAIGPIAYNPASQIVSQDRSNTAFSFPVVNDNTAGTANGLNQLTQVGTKALTHDTRGNVTAFGTKAFTYSSENLLLTGPGGASLSYDPLGRLYQVASASGTRRFLYDGMELVDEFDGAGGLREVYVWGAITDEPILWQNLANGTFRTLFSDERGSVVALADEATGAFVAANVYDEYGRPGAANAGAFGYTGQMWLPELGVYYYKARMYDPELGRFLQTDPLGYADSPNPYAYVLNDPVNFTDPLGMSRLRPVSLNTLPRNEGGGASASTDWTTGWTWNPTNVSITVGDSAVRGPSGFWTWSPTFSDLSFAGGWGGRNAATEPGGGGGQRSSPQNNQNDESLLQCVAGNLDAGGLTGAVVGGAAAIGVGAPILPKALLTGRSGTLSGGANRSGRYTSVLSAAARGFIGQGPKLEPGGFLARLTNTGKVATAVGRIASTASIVGGVALEAVALGEAAVETYRCANS